MSVKEPELLKSINVVLRGTISVVHKDGQPDEIVLHDTDAVTSAHVIEQTVVIQVPERMAKLASLLSTAENGDNSGATMLKIQVSGNDGVSFKYGEPVRDTKT